MLFLSLRKSVFLTLMSLFALPSSAAPTDMAGTSPPVSSVIANTGLDNHSLQARWTHSPAVSNKCWSSAEFVHHWNEYGMLRTRMKFDTNQYGMTHSDWMHAKWMWDWDRHWIPFQRCFSECPRCITVNVQVYFHKELNAWVLDSSEVAGHVGVANSFMALRRFAWRWERWVGCELDTLSTEVYFAPSDGPMAMRCWEAGYEPGEPCIHADCILWEGTPVGDRRPDGEVNPKIRDVGVNLTVIPDKEKGGRKKRKDPLVW